MVELAVLGVDNNIVMLSLGVDVDVKVDVQMQRLTFPMEGKSRDGLMEGVGLSESLETVDRCELSIPGSHHTVPSTRREERSVGGLGVVGDDRIVSAG